MTVLYLILPVLAVVAILFLFIRPLVKLWNCSVLEFGFNEKSSRELAEFASKRKQADEFETLIELGFEPMGTAWDQFAFMGNRDKENEHSIVMRHPDFPVCGELCINCNEQRFIKFYSYDSADRLLVTSSSPDTPKSDKPEYKSQVIDAAYSEQVFEFHMRELQQWEKAGFRGQPIRSLDDHEQAGRIECAQPKIKKLLWAVVLSYSFGSLTVTLITPAIIASVFASFVFKGIGVWGAVQVAAIWSMVSSWYWWNNVVNIKPSQQQNTLRGEHPTTKPQHIELTTSNSGEAIFDLPNRDIKPVKQHAMILGLFAILAAFFIATIGTVLFSSLIFAGKANFMGFISGMFPCLIFLLMMRQALPMAGLLFHGLKGTSRNLISIKEGLLRSSELSWVNNFEASMPIDTITKIHVEQITQRKDLIRWFADSEIDHWGVVEVVSESGEQSDLAIAYDLSIVIGVAEQLRAQVGLEEVELSEFVEMIVGDSAMVVPAENAKPGKPLVAPFVEPVASQQNTVS